jgi:hypothetical protein
LYVWFGADVLWRMTRPTPDPPPTSVELHIVADPRRLLASAVVFAPSVKNPIGQERPKLRFAAIAARTDELRPTPKPPSSHCCWLITRRLLAALEEVRPRSSAGRKRRPRTGESLNHSITRRTPTLVRQFKTLSSNLGWPASRDAPNSPSLVTSVFKAKCIVIPTSGVATPPFLPNVIVKPRRRLARGVRKHDS